MIRELRSYDSDFRYFLLLHKLNQWNLEEVEFDLTGECPSEHPSELPRCKWTHVDKHLVLNIGQHLASRTAANLGPEGSEQTVVVNLLFELEAGRRDGEGRAGVLELDLDGDGPAAVVGDVALELVRPVGDVDVARPGFLGHAADHAVAVVDVARRRQRLAALVVHPQLRPLVVQIHPRLRQRAQRDALVREHDASVLRPRRPQRHRAGVVGDVDRRVVARHDRVGGTGGPPLSCHCGLVLMTDLSV